MRVAAAVAVAVAACQKVVAAAVALFVPGSSFGLSCHAPICPPQHMYVFVFLGSSIWSKAEQLSVKMRNTYAQSAHKTTTTKSALSAATPPDPPTPPTPLPPLRPCATDPLHPPPLKTTHGGPWPCHLLNEMSSKLAVNLFAIFLALLRVRSAICCFARFQFSSFSF